MIYYFDLKLPLNVPSLSQHIQNKENGSVWTLALIRNNYVSMIWETDNDDDDYYYCNPTALSEIMQCVVLPNAYISVHHVINLITINCSEWAQITANHISGKIYNI